MGCYIHIASSAGHSNLSNFDQCPLSERGFSFFTLSFLPTVWLLYPYSKNFIGYTEVMQIRQNERSHSCVKVCDNGWFIIRTLWWALSIDSHVLNLPRISEIGCLPVIQYKEKEQKLSLQLFLTTSQFLHLKTKMHSVFETLCLLNICNTTYSVQCSFAETATFRRDNKFSFWNLRAFSSPCNILLKQVSEYCDMEIHCYRNHLVTEHVSVDTSNLQIFPWIRIRYIIRKQDWGQIR
jgi:hypothetical protein